MSVSALIKIGLIFEFRNKFHKLVDIEWGPDNSFYFYPFRHESELRERLKSSIDENGLLSFSADEIEGDHFPTKKISRHPSGYFHLKDVVGSGGNREKDGLLGAKFGDDGFYVFLVAFPQSIDSLVEVEQIEPSDVIAHLPDNIEPFTVQFAAWDQKSKILIPDNPNALLGHGVIAITNDQQEFGLVTMFVNVRKTSSEVVARFPKRTTYIVR